MRDCAPQPSVLTVLPWRCRRLSWAGVGLGGLLARLGTVCRCWFGAGAFHAGYALRERQAANRQRQACPACRARIAVRRSR